MLLKQLESYLDTLLNISHFSDYCPNGLQVEGRSEIKKIVSGVTASLELLHAAIDENADAIVVHHGYFWRGEDTRLVGIRKRRIELLLANKVSLFAYHLPLDAHPTIGNNAQLGKRLSFIEAGRFGEQNIAMYGTSTQELTLGELGTSIEKVLLRKPLIIGNKDMRIQDVAWCTGAAQDYFDDAIHLGVDAYITGEISERIVHVARESKVAFIAAGHHATERYGVQELGESLAKKFGIKHTFIDINNPV
ncbi:MAG: Nif3-like dinuclear metal center hexameric protein [Nitrosomonadaceae bacterium]|nr:Nif3-like dinuclear metal center hexameric protein [Nitrosomonadaceae bacterium]|tara:strand:+ start:301 stop:1047 length:747 start_codon:yes stop_codon:yes gene_type:complete